MTTHETILKAYLDGLTPKECYQLVKDVCTLSDVVLAYEVHQDILGVK